MKFTGHCFQLSGPRDQFLRNSEPSNYLIESDPFVRCYFPSYIGIQAYRFVKYVYINCIDALVVVIYWGPPRASALFFVAFRIFLQDSVVQDSLFVYFARIFCGGLNYNNFIFQCVFHVQ